MKKIYNIELDCDQLCLLMHILSDGAKEADDITALVVDIKRQARETGKPVLETWSRETVARVNTARYEVLTALEWLQRFNRSVRDA